MSIKKTALILLAAALGCGLFLLWGELQRRLPLFQSGASAGPPAARSLKAGLLRRSPCRGGAPLDEAPRKAGSGQKAAAEGGRPSRLALLDRLADQPLDWIIQDINGEAVDFACYRGKARVVINLWATWCPPCIEELPALARLAQKSGILAAAVSTEPEAKVRQFIEKSFPGLSRHLKIAAVSAEEQKALFPEDPLPVTYLFNKEGKLAMKASGPRAWDDPHLTKQINSL